MHAHLEKMHTRNPAAFINKLILTQETLAAYANGAALHTDDNARLEYSAPKALVRGRSPYLLEELYGYRSKPADMLKSLQWVDIDPRIKKNLAAMFQAKLEVLGGYTEGHARGATKEALKRFENALSINPTDYDAAYMLAMTNYDIASAYEDARRPDAATRAYEKSVAVIDNFIGQDRSKLPDHFRLDVIFSKANLHIGTLALRANRLEHAAASFKKSIAGEIRYAQAHNNLGIVYERTGKYEAAVTQYKQAIELDPSLVSAYMNLGNTRLKQKQYKESIESYQQVRKLKPDFAITNYNLGMAYFQQAQWQKAEAEWEQALALKPDFDQARQGLKAVRQKMGTQ
jgi:tetratricopeptide (TPR) repeat protein